MLSKAHICMLMACCLLLFAKTENFVKYTFIYIIQLLVSTLLHLILPLNFFDSAFPISWQVEAVFATINARMVPCLIELLVS